MISGSKGSETLKAGDRAPLVHDLNIAVWLKINGHDQHNLITSVPVCMHQHFGAHRHLVAV